MRIRQLRLRLRSPTEVDAIALELNRVLRGWMQYYGRYGRSCAASFFELADVEKNAREGNKGKPVSPTALEAVRRSMRCSRSSALSHGRSADQRRAVRQEESKPLLEGMHAWLLRDRETLSRSSEVLKPMNYMLRRGTTSAAFSTMAGSA
ncbi:hypothetical protein J2R96_002039 [Bradyrhizobium elkanii]|nr:hypothetical protein [Bradyrhizobium elkanii]